MPDESTKLILNAWCRIFLEKLIILPLVETFPEELSPAI
jgi:hypothetical protein